MENVRSGLRLQVVVAKVDGVAGLDGAAFLPGSCVGVPRTVPVCLGFDPDRRQIASAALELEGTDLVAVLAVDELRRYFSTKERAMLLGNLYPAIGYRAILLAPNGKAVMFEPVAVELSRFPNADPRIQQMKKGRPLL